MQVFHIKGLSGILMFIITLISAALIILALPAAFMMVLWNAVAYEMFHAPEINFYQGFLLWGMMLVAIKLIFQPEIRFQLMRDASGKPPGKSPFGSKDKDSDPK